MMVAPALRASAAMRRDHALDGVVQGAGSA
jgi:hypothetical protein